MKRTAVLFSIFLLTCFTITKAQLPQAVTNRLQFVIDSISNRYDIKGVSAAVLVPRAGVWKGVSGESYSGKPLNTDMLFCMGSNTKTFIAAMILKLQEHSLVSLDDTIGTWIHDHPYINGKITIRQCLNHTSGLYDYFHNEAINDSIFDNPSKIWEMKEILNLVKAPSFNPGVKHSYSNTNYIIAGIIIQDILKKSPYTAISDWILKPIGLNHTFNYGEEPSSEELAHPWTVVLGPSLVDLTTKPYLGNLFGLASTAGSLITTAEDNVWFWHKLFSGEIISASSWKEMTTMVNVTNGVEYGLGIFRSRNSNGRVVYYHNGTFFGFLCENLVDTLSGVCISVLSNQDSLNNYGLRELYLKSLQKEILKTPLLSIPIMGKQNYNIVVYPNPANNVLNVKINEPLNTDMYVELYDLKGKRVYHTVISGQNTTLDMHGLSNGLYLLNIRDEKAAIRYSQRVVISSER